MELKNSATMFLYVRLFLFWGWVVVYNIESRKFRLNKIG